MPTGKGLSSGPRSFQSELPQLNCYRRKVVASLKLLPKGGRIDPGDSTRVRGELGASIQEGEASGERADPGRILQGDRYASEGGGPAAGGGGAAEGRAQGEGAGGWGGDSGGAEAAVGGG